LGNALFLALDKPDQNGGASQSAEIKITSEFGTIYPAVSTLPKSRKARA